MTKNGEKFTDEKKLNIFLFLWVIFALLDPDPDFESGYGSTDLMNPDQDEMVFWPIHSLLVWIEGIISRSIFILACYNPR